MFREKQNWLQEAKENEVPFRLFAKYKGFKFDDADSIEDIFQVYTEGDRWMKPTIHSFKKLEEDKYEFSWGDEGPLSGGGDTTEYICKDGKLVSGKVTSIWMH
jgi:hypothetical protein